jgi:hypothetical protein
VPKDIDMASAVQEPVGLTPVNGAKTNGANGAANGASSKVFRFDPNFTDNVINATGPKAHPRVRQVIGSLTRHLHDFCRENEITVDEFMMGIDLVGSPLMTASNMC